MSNTKELNAVKTRLTKEKKEAEAEVRRIDSALQKICSALEELKGVKASTGKKKEKSSTRATKAGSKRPVGKRNWSDSQRKEAASRMKDYWAKKKKGTKRGKVARRAAKETVEEAHDASAPPAPQVVVPPQAVA